MGNALILLAGGKSSRFGRDKTQLELAGRRLVPAIVDACRPFCGELFVVSNAQGKFGLPGVTELRDIYPDTGPLGGIHAGLTASQSEKNLVVACDMPFFSPELAQRLLEESGGHLACVPRVGDKLQPLLAVYDRALLPRAEELLRAGRRPVRGLYEDTDTLFLDCGDWCRGGEAAPGSPFYNINYPEDFTRLL
ncbi:putative molybdenum cofactor guanylyltransferase [Oscillospiraceae bacterium]|nr:putative molybdenum cofactor guanylyltransferase [Oscillospiraceae bacterium]